MLPLLQVYRLQIKSSHPTPSSISGREKITDGGSRSKCAPRPWSDSAQTLARTSLTKEQPMTPSWTGPKKKKVSLPDTFLYDVKSIVNEGGSLTFLLSRIERDGLAERLVQVELLENRVRADHDRHVAHQLRSWELRFEGFDSLSSQFRIFNSGLIVTLEHKERTQKNIRVVTGLAIIMARN